MLKRITRHYMEYGAKMEQKMFCFCYDAPEPPDLSASIEGSKEIADQNMELAHDQMRWAKEQDSMNRATLGKVLDVQLPAMQMQADNAKKDRERYETKFQPLEDNLVKEFQGYDTEGRRANERARAGADVTSSFDAARRNALQRLESYGVDPSQTRNAALDIGVRTQQAAAQAGAMSNATRNTENTGRALRAEAINIGKGMPSNVAQSYAGSLNAGNSAVGNSNATTGAGANALTSGLGFTGQALGGYGQMAGIQNSGYANQMTQFNANQAGITGALGAAGGVAGMLMADGGDVPPDGKRPPMTFDNDTGEPLQDSMPGTINGPGDGSGIDDQVDIKASAGEYIIPADVVRKKGEEFFDKLVERYHTPAAQQREDPYVNQVRSGKAISPRPSAA